MFVEIIQAFTFYGADVFVLAVPTALLTQLLKVTLLKNVQKKAVTFVPFIIGTALYAAYTCILRMSVCSLFSEWAYVIGQGFSVGAAATFLYVLYEQFARAKDGGSLIEGVTAALLEGFVPDDSLLQAASEAAGVLSCGGGEQEVLQVLLKYAEEGADGAELLVLSGMIVKTASAFTKDG